MNYADIDIGLLQEYVWRVKEQRRNEFLQLLLDDPVVKNNRNLQEKYMEIYDRNIN